MSNIFVESMLNTLVNDIINIKGSKDLSSDDLKEALRTSVESQVSGMVDLLTATITAGVPIATDGGVAFKTTMLTYLNTL